MNSSVRGRAPCRLLAKKRGQRETTWLERQTAFGADANSYSLFVSPAPGAYLLRHHLELNMAGGVSVLIRRSQTMNGAAAFRVTSCARYQPPLYLPRRAFICFLPICLSRRLCNSIAWAAETVPSNSASNRFELRRAAFVAISRGTTTPQPRKGAEKRLRRFCLRTAPGEIRTRREDDIASGDDASLVSPRCLRDRA